MAAKSIPVVADPISAASKPQVSEITAATEITQLASSLSETDIYVVEAGDTLSGIATRFGISLEAILAINPLPDPDQLSIDQILSLPLADKGQ